jgi:hypothetical protein
MCSKEIILFDNQFSLSAEETNERRKDSKLNEDQAISKFDRAESCFQGEKLLKMKNNKAENAILGCC